MYITFEEVIKMLQQCNRIKEIVEYVKEWNGNIVLLSNNNANPMDVVNQVHKLAGKYEAEINTISSDLKNNVTVVHEVTCQKSVYEWRAELEYINGIFPQIIFLHEGLNELKKNLNDMALKC